MNLKKKLQRFIEHVNAESNDHNAKDATGNYYAEEDLTPGAKLRYYREKRQLRESMRIIFSMQYEDRQDFDDTSEVVERVFTLKGMK